MGGASTEIGDGTTNVLLEAAHWEPTGVARTARRHRLPSEAAKRFERGVDPEMTVVALARAAELLAEYGGAQVVGGVVDVDTRGPRPTDRARRGQARPGRRRALHRGPGRRAPRRRRLRRRRERQPARRHAAVLAPRPDRPGRPGRGGRPARRVRRHPVGPADGAARPRAHRRAAPPAQRRPHAGRGRVRRGAVLPVRRDGGARRARACRTTTRAAQVVVVRNPLSEEEPGLRTTLLPGLLATLARNLSRGQRDLALFEHGAVFPGGVRTPAPLPGVEQPSGRRDAGRAAGRRARSSRGTWPSRWPATASRAAGGAPGRPAGWADAVRGGPAGRRRLGRRADGARRGAGAVAPGPLRRAGRRRPGGRARRRAAPAGVRGPGAAGADVGHGARRRRAAGGRRCRSGRRSRPSRRCYIDLALVVTDEVPAAEVADRAARGRRRAARVAAAVRRLHRPAGAGRARGRWRTR